MKRVILMALLALALPLSAFAGSSVVDFANAGGTLTGSNAGLTLSGSELVGVLGLNGMGVVGGDLGSVSFSTGALMSGDLSTCKPSCTFGPGGTFVITGNGTNQVPNGAIFTGTFSSFTVTLYKGSMGGANIYYFTANVTGTWANGSTSSGSINGWILGKGFNGTSSFLSGNTYVSTVPEPGTLGLLGAGLVGLAGLLRRKAKA